jgi:RNA polymerase sigma-54 factor
MPQERTARELARRARALLAAVEYRRTTILRIGNAVAEKQAGFFLRGAGSHVPLTRREIADELQLSRSTVSRTVSEKSFLYKGRVHQLSELFSSGVKQASGDAMSSTAIQERIAEIIKANPDQAGLSDAEITRRLHKQGVDIARRTVAKYRQCLSIPSSFQRQRIRRIKRQGIRTKPQTPATDD